ncbi:hypothetical protein [Synechococcus sp. CB0205]|uniref:hypothetical protein n=1 Tax=Synechococcus sp. CB0205 TaxID=232363 RepID=UPI0002002B5D|nr:hypothetical protein [Synechococcus sp. CB0205]
MQKLLPLLVLPFLVGCGASPKQANDQLYAEFFAAEQQASEGLKTLRTRYGGSEFAAMDRRHARFLGCMVDKRKAADSFPAAVTACRIESEAGK